MSHISARGLHRRPEPSRMTVMSACGAGRPWSASMDFKSSSVRRGRKRSRVVRKKRSILPRARASKGSECKSAVGMRAQASVRCWDEKWPTVAMDERHWPFEP
jgi:hypothetical protein